MYIRSDIAHRVRIDFQHPELETVWAEILLPKTRHILVGTCYRPPKQMNFYDLMEQCCIDTNRSITSPSRLRRAIALAHANPDSSEQIIARADP